ncbi:galactoside alpha-(1,2)-fucosyltransferase 2-like [Lissotriton helveticus]
MRRSRKCHCDPRRLMLKHRRRKICLLFLVLYLSLCLVTYVYFLHISTLCSFSNTCPCTISWSEKNKSIHFDNHSSVWTIRPMGRLGNQMGQYAALYALAEINGRPAYIFPEMYQLLSQIFKISLPVLPRSNATAICWKEYELHDWMSNEYRTIKGKYVKLIGYPCSWTFYHPIQDEIRREFTFHDFIKEEVNQHLNQLRGDRKHVTYIGIHVRRGDYVYVMPKIWKGVLADKDYLQNAMAYFRKKYPEPVFIVASDGMQWCKENIDASKGDVYFLDDGIESTSGKDFALLAHCNHTIMTIGTFGYWAGYLAGGETVYLTNFTLPESPFLSVFHYEAAFLPHWVGIPADLSVLYSN